MTATQVMNRIPLDDYSPLLGSPEVDEIRAMARPLRGKTVQMVNSTAVGGGVAEILNRLIPLAEELEIDIHWDVMKGGADFFSAQEPVPAQHLRADEERVAGEGREGLIGRVPEPGRPQRQHLPGPLTGPPQCFDQIVGLGAEVARPARTGQGGDVQ